MDERILELLEMQKANEKKAPQHNQYPPAVVPTCINNDYCVLPPRDKNNGILTMAFVDMQPLESVYPPETAFEYGSLFPNINKPFNGGRK